MKFVPKYDKDFAPMSMVLNKFIKETSSQKSVPLKICVERNCGYNYTYAINIFEDESKHVENYRICERLIKTILWVVGGKKIYICGPKYIYDGIKQDYSACGKRQFDFNFMSTVYETPLEVVYCDEKSFPKPNICSLKVGGNFSGCRIGFDAGGSDRKVSAVIDGKTVYSEEVIWNPKLNEDYHYHYEGIKQAWQTAASKMPRVDAVGVSSAGVYIDNKIMVSALFMKVPEEIKNTKVRTLYLDLAKEMNVKVEVANDGDVTALAGAMELNSGSVLGIAMGTSQAGGYINAEGNLNGWISELAFVPVDFNEAAARDEWSGDVGCGVKYFSQDSIIKLSQNAGLDLNGETPAEKLKCFQDLFKVNNQIAYDIYADIGMYLGYAIPYYAMFYDIKYLLVMGRVVSGDGGHIIVEVAKKVLKDEFNMNIDIRLPDENSRRVGQSIAAASLTVV